MAAVEGLIRIHSIIETFFSKKGPLIGAMGVIVRVAEPLFHIYMIDIWYIIAKLQLHVRHSSLLLY